MNDTTTKETLDLAKSIDGLMEKAKRIACLQSHIMVDGQGCYESDITATALEMVLETPNVAIRKSHDGYVVYKSMPCEVGQYWHDEIATGPTTLHAMLNALKENQ